MTETTTNPTGDNAQNSQDSKAGNTPKPSPTPTPSTLSKEPTPSTDTSQQATSEQQDSSEQSSQDPTQDQAYLDKHASLRNRDGEGSPGDISGARLATEVGYEHPADFSGVTGRDQVSDSER